MTLYCTSQYSQYPRIFVLEGTARLPLSCASAHLTVLMSLPLFGRDQVVNSEIPVNQSHREFWAKSPARGCNWGSFFRTPELNREPETSGEFAGLARIPRKTGIQRKTPRGTLSAFSVNLIFRNLKIKQALDLRFLPGLPGLAHERLHLLWKFTRC